MSPRRLILVDGTFALYRSYFAIKHLSTSDGTPTNALFGLVRLIGQLREQWRPTHLAVIFDGGSPARRLALLPEYKAQRPPMPTDLRSQFPLAEEYLAAARVRWLRLDNEEADDVMATIATRACAGCDPVLLLTNDKDLFQIVGGPIALLSAGAKGEPMGPAAVRERTGVAPDRIVDWLALIGDSVDNIPGVPGVGPKTAARLIAEFGSVSGLWNRLGEVASDKLRSTLASCRCQVERNMSMVRLDTGVDVPVQIDDLALRDEDRSALLAFYDRMQFTSLARGLREPDLFGSMGVVEG